MFRPSAELVVLFFGMVSVIAAFQHIPDIRTRGTIFLFVFGVELITQAGAHLIQYTYAVAEAESEATKIDHETAVALFAFESKDPNLLARTTDNPYFVGYRYFEDGKYDKATRLLRRAIAEQRYVASSYYLLAFMATHNSNKQLKKGDYTEAFDDLDNAIKLEPDYAQAYYLKAILLMNIDQQAAALNTLQSAVTPSGAASFQPCQDINSNSNTDWASLRGNGQFKELQQECKQIHGQV